MKEAIIIKSYPNGINLILNSETEFEILLQEIAYKFKESRSFFGSASVALSYDGRLLNHAEELQLIDTIKENSNLNLICIVGKDENTNKNFIKALQKVDQKLTAGNEGQFYKGTLKNNEVIETESSIVVIGSVYPGSVIISAKNIIILGGLYGEAHAGGNGNQESYIAAFEMEPEQLKIGDFIYKCKKQNKWGIRPKMQPKIAYIKNDKIILEPLTKDILASF